MIDYAPGKWHLVFICRLQGSVFPKAFCWALPSGVFSVAVFYFAKEYDIQPDEKITQIWGSYMFVLGFLIVFRSQQAYSRFWEGTTLLNQVRGEWFNAISSLFAFCSEESEKQHDVKIFQHLIVRLMSLLYCSALQQIATMEDEAFEILDFAGISPDSIRFLMTHSDERCEILLQWIQKLICMNIGTGVVPIAPPILSRVFQELARGIVGVNDATKISDILFPFPYAQMISVMLLITACVLPWVAGTVMVSSTWAGGLTFISVFAYASINYIAAEIELPFGDDANDLPVAEYQRSMNRYLLVLMEEQTQHPPRFTPVVPLSEPCGVIKMRDDIVEQVINKTTMTPGVLSAYTSGWKPMEEKPRAPSTFGHVGSSIEKVRKKLSTKSSNTQPGESAEIERDPRPTVVPADVPLANNGVPSGTSSSMPAAPADPRCQNMSQQDTYRCQGLTPLNSSNTPSPVRQGHARGSSDGTDAGYMIEREADEYDAGYQGEWAPMPPGASNQSGQQASVQLFVRLDAISQMSSGGQPHDHMAGTASQSADRAHQSALQNVAQPQPAAVPNPPLML